MKKRGCMVEVLLETTYYKRQNLIGRLVQVRDIRPVFLLVLQFLFRTIQYYLLLGTSVCKAAAVIVPSPISLTMALAIDTRHLLERWIPDQEDYLDAYVGSRGRFQLHRVCAYATVIHNCSTIKRRQFDQDVQKAALDWQADPDDDLHEVEVFHYLKQLAATSSLVPGFPQQDTTTTTLVASVQSPTFFERVQERPLSSFHRYSVNMIMEDTGNGHTYGSKTTLSEVIPDVTRRGSLWACVNDPKIVWAISTERCDLSVVWHIQLDFVDLLNPITQCPDSSPGKRRRTLNLFQQVPTRCVEDRSRGSHPPEAKRFKGVRYRPERRTWIAEMKPPRSRNKVSFGDFKSQTQAARAVDAAFHHFGKPLNFADTPQILSALPTSTGLNEEAKLKLVKEQAKWIASIASTLPSNPTSPFTRVAAATASEPFEFSESSTICTAVTSGFRSFSEITSPLSCGGADEADDGVSQPDPMAGFVVNEVETMEPNFTAADQGGFVNEFEERQSMFMRGEEDVIVDPCDIAIN